jgi:hypothetical protein
MQAPALTAPGVRRPPPLKRTLPEAFIKPGFGAKEAGPDNVLGRSVKIRFIFG